MSGAVVVRFGTGWTRFACWIARFNPDLFETVASHSSAVSARHRSGLRRRWRHTRLGTREVEGAAGWPMATIRHYPTNDGKKMVATITCRPAGLQA
jgi:hypothetical protein